MQELLEQHGFHSENSQVFPLTYDIIVECKEKIEGLDDEKKGFCSSGMSKTLSWGE